MPWNAIDALDDARAATQSLLLPVELGRWVRLAVIALFVGGGIGFPGGGNAGFTGGGGGGQPVPPPDGGTLPMPDAEFTRLAGAVVIGILVVAVVLVLLFALIGAVMEFVLVEGLRSREVRIRRNFRQYLGAGLRLFVFRAIVVFALLAAIGLPLAAVFLAGVNLAPAYFALLVPLLFVFLAIGLVVAVVLLFTTDFVVPTMIAEELGVVAAWRRVLSVVRREWREFGLYVVARFVLGIAAGIAVGLVLAVLALLIALPFLLIGLAIFFALGAAVGTVGIGGWILLGAVFLAYVAVLFAVGAAVQVPVVTYFRYYALFFLGAETPELDLVAVLRTHAGGAAEG